MAADPTVAADPARRALLAAMAALPLLVAGCRGAQALGTPPQPAPDVAQLRRATLAEEFMIARYRAAIAALRSGRGGTSGGPAATALLAGLLAEHERHRQQLRSFLIPGSPLAAGSAPAARSPAPILPREATQVMSYLSHAESAASDRLLGQLRSVPPSLAQLLASISASEATHVPVLVAAGRT